MKFLFLYFVVIFIFSLSSQARATEKKTNCKDGVKILEFTTDELEEIVFLSKLPGYGDKISKTREKIKSRILSGDICPDREWGSQTKYNGYSPFPKECFIGECSKKGRANKSCVLKHFDNWWGENNFDAGNNADLLAAFSKTKSLPSGIYEQKFGTPCVIASLKNAMSEEDRSKIPEMKIKKAFLDSQLKEDGTGLESWRYETRDNNRMCGIPERDGGSIYVHDERARKCFKHVLEKFDYSAIWLDNYGYFDEKKLSDALNKKQKILVSFTCDLYANPIKRDTNITQVAHQVQVIEIVKKDGKDFLMYADTLSGIKTIELDLFKSAYIPHSAYILKKNQ